jgi:undecaprenyl-diphosphatase
MTRVDGPVEPSLATARPEEHALLGSLGRDIITTIVLAVLTASLFVLVATPARASILRIDEALLQRIVSVRSHPLTAVARFLNLLGLAVITLPVRLLIAGFLAAKRRWWHLSAFVSAVILSEFSIGLLKALYDRPRPPGSLVAVTGGSFPSGHAVAASVTAVAAVIALFPEGPRRYWWGLGAAMFSLLMGLSRAYLAAHWLSDAVAGVLLGTSFALISALVVHFVRSRTETPTGSGSRSRPGTG